MNVTDAAVRRAIDQVSGADIAEVTLDLVSAGKYVANAYEDLIRPRPLDEWHEDDGPALWWKFPVQEPPFSGGPNDSDWPGYHTHWTPIPMPRDPGQNSFCEEHT